MEKGKQVVGVDDEQQPKPLYFKNVLYILRRFFRYIDEHPYMFRWIKIMRCDLIPLQAFLTHGPQELDEEDGTLEEIHFFAHEAAMIISEYDLDGMDTRQALGLERSVNSNLAMTSLRMDLIRMIIYGNETTEALRVCFDKDIVQTHLDALLGPEPLLEDKEFEITIPNLGYVVSSLGQFLKYVEHDLVVVPGMKQFRDEVALLQAFFIDRPQPFFKIRRLMNQILYMAQKANTIMWEHDLEEEEEMDRHKGKAFELSKRLNSVFKLMPHWLDLIRIIYGKHPKASPSLYCLVDNLAPLDALLDYLLQSPSALSSFKRSHALALGRRVVLLRAILMDPPQKLIEDGTLKVFECIAREVGFTISSIDLNNMDLHVADALHDWLFHFFVGQSTQSWKLMKLESKVEKIYAEMPKPSRVFYPKTAQLDFVDLLLDNVGELLLEAADDASLIRLLYFDILPLRRELEEVSCRLTEMPEPRKQEADVKDNITNITNLAYEAEFVIDSFLVADIPIWCSMVWLRDILDELVKQKLLIKSGFGDAESIVHSVLGKFSVGQHQIVPIFHNDTEICDTLEKVFNKIRQFGYACMRSLVSSYAERKREVFLDLLHSAGINVDSDSEAELEKFLYDFLIDQRYVVILEDLRDIYVLNDIKRVLPLNQEQINAIVFTTPSPELVVQCRYGSNQISEHHPSTSQADKPTIEKDVVGFTKETERMLEQLLGGPERLLIISIVGTAGQGKTTLATKLFNHPSIEGYFYTRACCISQVYEKRQLLLELLSQVVQLSKTNHHGKTNMELAEMLYKQLKGQRFLIFLDDMWRIDAWKDLARCFPDDKKGSRIIFTTRMQGLAHEMNSILQPLGLLSDEESWKLLENKLFLNECCSIELLEVGRKIAKNCKGLPLAVVLIAGLLLKMEKKVDHWERIAKNLSLLILDDPESKGKGVIELSYKHLPDHLKSCFLYFGVFLEDREVQVSTLIRLWIGEGLVKHSDSKSLEDVAEDYVRDLVGRSLVTIAQEKSNGGVKSCRVHDLLREFCLTKASEENFLQLLDGYDEQDLSFDHNQDPNNNSSSFTRIKYHLHRLWIYPKGDHFSLLKSCGPYVRSLLFFAVSDRCPSYTSDILFIFQNFKLHKILNLEGINVGVKILNLKGINIGDSFKEIGHLVLLRYLACQSDVDLIPSSIANLWNLQTFLFKGLGNEVVNVSDSLWDMTALRHMHINKSASFDLGPDRLENSSLLENLQTFSTPSLAYGDDTERMLRRIQGIRKLKCVFLDSWDDATNCNQFPELGFLSQLVSLNVFYNGKGRYPCEFNFPSNLKKLTLSNFRMPWNEISQLAQLCELEVLKLLGNAFEGETWDMEDVVLPKVKFLKLDTLNVINWSATDDHLPSLERLVLHKCDQLVEIPPSIGEIQTLQMIEVMWCNSSAAISALKIQEEQLEYGGELKIHVHPKI